MRITYNSPVVLSYSAICLLILFAASIGLDSVLNFFTLHGHFDAKNPVNFIQLVSHSFGHSDWKHFVGNFTFILLIGPMLEEKYGSFKLLQMMLVTAFVTGVIHAFFFTTGMRGASGIVFMMIILSSFSNYKSKSIPLTFILVVTLFLGREVFHMFQTDNISQFAHILGGSFGAVFGFVFTKPKKEVREVKPSEDNTKHIAYSEDDFVNADVLPDKSDTDNS